MANDDGRIRLLNENPVRTERDFVLYWMQASQRVSDNPALAHAVEVSREINRPVVVYFGLTPSYPEANRRHFRFLLDGINDVSRRLESLRIPFRMFIGELPDVVLENADGACVIVTDRGYLRHQREWRTSVAERCDVRVVQVESDVVVPIESASDKEEYAARTIRKKITEQVDRFLETWPVSKVDTVEPDLPDGIDLASFELEALDIEQTPGPVEDVRGGEESALALLDEFLESRFSEYDERRNEITARTTTELSPYLHFGQISPTTILLRAREIADPDDPNLEALEEELIVRRELACNFVFYNDSYDSYDALPDWARTSLDEHRDDPREYTYELDALESAETHDRYWNAAMREMVRTGRMQNYMRMYWGKKVLEWSRTPEEAFEHLLLLNNRYFLDGRDPNSYANVAWIFGKHDRPWQERPIYGKVRYMNANGLRRKFDPERYAEMFGDPDDHSS